MKVTLGDWINIAVTLDSTDKDLKLIVPECKATPEREPDSQPQFFFIREKYVIT